MKESEFEEKIRDVSDGKLRRMLEKSRSDGPEIAVQLLLSEVGRRGLPDQGQSEGGLSEDAPTVRVASPNAAAVANSHQDFEAALQAKTSIPQAEWIHEEATASRSFTLIKVILFLGALGGGLYLLLKYTRS